MSNDPVRRGLCFVLAAPSGAGKSTILRRLIRDDPALSLSISATTRAPRPGERDGVDYLFTDQAGFEALVAAGAMLEWAQVFGRCYGTPRDPVEQALSAGRDVAFDIDWQGHRLVRAAMPGDVVSVFIRPPSLDHLRLRLQGRGGDSAEEISRRMDAAQSEMDHAGEFEHVVVNEDLDQAVAEVRAILHAARQARTEAQARG
jgi:guanylate kinase